MDKFTFFKVSMPKSRKADYQLGYFDGAVFLDFEDFNGRIYLVRISFDGYGCCDLTGSKKPLSREESSLFTSEIDQEHLNQDVITLLVKKAVAQNNQQIWREALEKYGLV